MSTKDNASEAPDGAPPAAVPLKRLYDEEFETTMKTKATNWKDYLATEVKAQVFENQKHKKFLERSGIREKWEGKMGETGEYADLDVGTLQDVVTLYADLAEFKKDVKQIDVWEKKVALNAKKDEMRKATAEMGDAAEKAGELHKALEELVKTTEELGETAAKMGELREKISGLQEEIDQLDKDLYEARECRKDEDRHLVRRLKEYLSKITLPPAVDESDTPPLSPLSEIDSEFSQQSAPPPEKEPPKKAAPKKEPPTKESSKKESSKKEPPKKEPPKKGKKAATVTDASD